MVSEYLVSLTAGTRSMKMREGTSLSLLRIGNLSSWNAGVLNHNSRVNSLSCEDAQVTLFFCYQGLS